MMRRSTLTILLSLLVAVLFIAGCSDDDTTTPTGNVIGDPNSAQFQETRAAIATAVDSTICQLFVFAADPDRYRITDPMDTLGDIRAELGVTSPADTVLYNYVNGWHVLYLGLTTLADYNATFVDSARFLANSVVQMHVNENTDELDLIRHQNTEYDGSSQDYWNVSLYANSNFADYQSVGQVINSTGNVVIEDHYLDGSTPVTKTYDFTVVIEDLSYDWESDMTWDEITATGGALTITGTISDGTSFSSWTVTVDFNSDGTGDVTATTGSTTYEYEMTLFED